MRISLVLLSLLSYFVSLVVSFPVQFLFCGRSAVGFKVGFVTIVLEVLVVVAATEVVVVRLLVVPSRISVFVRILVIVALVVVLMSFAFETHCQTF